MNFLKQNYSIILKILVIVVSFAVVHSVNVSYAVCYCERTYCLEDDCPVNDPINPDFWHKYLYPPGDPAACPTNECLMRPAWGEPHRELSCTSCPYGAPDYGPIGTLRYSNTCVISCQGGGGDDGGPRTCDRASPRSYSCTTTNSAGYERYGLVQQIWATAGNYSPDNPDRERANWVGYSRTMDFTGDAQGLCNDWYALEYSGWINIPAGWHGFEMEIDYDYRKDCKDSCSNLGRPPDKKCCGSAACNCDKDDKCDDHLSNRSGIRLGYVGSGTAADPYRPNPASYIDTSTSTGFPRNVNWVAQADGPKHSLEGYYEAGWYMIQGWYNVGPGGRSKWFHLRHITVPGASYKNDSERVPEDWFRPCGQGVPPTDPPTAQITSPPEFSEYTVGQNVTIRAAAQDPENNMANIGIYYRKQTTGGTWGSWCKLFNGCADPNSAVPTCNDPVNCTLSRSWSGFTSGRYQAVVNAHDGDGGQCSGNPDIPLPAGWSNCDPISPGDCIASNACIEFNIDSAPICMQNLTNAMRWDDTLSPADWVSTTEYFRPNEPIAIKMISYDREGDNTLEFITASCTDSSGGTYTHNEFIEAAGSRFRIRARGTNYPGSPSGEWPRMLLAFRNSNGSSHYFGNCDWIVDNPNWDWYECTLPASTASYMAYFWIEFTNDHTTQPGPPYVYDKNLYIDFVRYYPNSADTSDFITLQGEHPQNAYDLATINDLNSIYDGQPLVHADNPNPTWMFPVGEAVMSNNGALKFPVIWRAPNVVGHTCTIVSNPAMTGNTCTQVITSRGLSINGRIRLTPDDDNPTCAVNSPASDFTQTDTGTNVSFWAPSTTLLQRAFVTAGTATYSLVELFFGDQVFDSFQINLVDTNDLVDYDLYCVQIREQDDGSGDPLRNEAHPGSLNVAPAIPDFVMNNKDLEVDFLLRELGNDKWFQASNGDIYSATPITGDIPDFEGDAVGFNNAKIFPTLVYRYDDVNDIHASIGGNVFGAPDSPPGVGVNEVGSYVEFAEYYPDGNDNDRGSIYMLDGDPDDSVVPSNSQWINEFDFEPPSRFDTAENKSSGFVLNDVYYITSGAFANFVSSGQFTLANDSDGRDEGVTVMYVAGNISDEIEFNNDFVNSEPNSKKSLIVVYPGRVFINSGVGHDYDDIVDANYVGYNERGDAPQIPNNIEAVILAGRGIETETIHDGVSVRDRILVVYGMLIAGNDPGGDNVALNRNLGRVANAEYPAEIVRYNQHVLHYLTILERDLSTAGGSFTGLGESYTGLDDFGVQFIYED